MFYGGHYPLAKNYDGGRRKTNHCTSGGRIIFEMNFSEIIRKISDEGVIQIRFETETNLYNGSSVRSKHLSRMRWALALGPLPFKYLRRTHDLFYNLEFCAKSNSNQTFIRELIHSPTKACFMGSLPYRKKR